MTDDWPAVVPPPDHDEEGGRRRLRSPSTFTGDRGAASVSGCAGPCDAPRLSRESTTFGKIGERANSWVKHFWHAITVRGWFERFEAEETVGSDGPLTGRLSIASALLNTKNKKRDKHLRSVDFFDVEAHPATVVTVGGATVDGRHRLSVPGELEATGRPPVDQLPRAGRGARFGRGDPADRARRRSPGVSV